MRCGDDGHGGAAKLLDLFFGYERPEIAEFRKAVEQFKADLPAVLDALRDMIDDGLRRQRRVPRGAPTSSSSTPRRRSTRRVGEADVREMLIQHILTEEIFAQVFDDGDFHRENNVAKELYALEGDVLHRRGEARHADGRWSPTTRPSAPPPR